MPQKEHSPLASEKTGFFPILVCSCFCIMAILISVVSIINLTSQTSLFTCLLCFILPLCGLMVLMFYCARGGIHGRLFVFLLFATAFMLKSAFALVVNTQPESDFHIMYYAAEQLAQGFGDLTRFSYFSYWPYQSAFVSFMAFFIRFFSADVLFFKLLNCLISALTSVLCYRLARRFSSEGGAQMAAMVFTLYPGTFMLISVLTNQHLAEFFLLAALCVFSAPASGLKGLLLRGGAGGLLLAVSNAFRPNGIIVILALLAYFVMQFFAYFRSNKVQLKEAALRAATLIVCYLAVGTSLSFFIQASGINAYGLTNNVPQWKWIVGLNEGSTGSYNSQDAQAVFSEGEVNQAAIDALMEERLSISPSRFIQLAWEKTKLMWGSFEPKEWAFTPDVYEEVEPIHGPFSLHRLLLTLCKFSQGLYIWIYILLGLGIIFFLSKKRISQAHLLMLIALLYFAVHLFIEVQPRYRSLMTVITFPLLGLGADAVTEGVKTLKVRFGQTGKQRTQDATTREIKSNVT